MDFVINLLNKALTHTEGRSHLIQFISTLLQSLSKIPYCTKYELHKNSFLSLYHMDLEKGHVPNTASCKLLQIVGEEFCLQFPEIFSCLVISNDGSMMNGVTPTRSAVNTIFGLCRIILQI